MSSSEDIQALLRFLSQDAKVPLAQALSKVKDLQAAKLNSASEISKSSIEPLKTVFNDEKLARQVLNAAKRISKKRGASDTNPVPPPKRVKPTYGQPLNAAELEASLALPEPELDEDKLNSTILYTNRAPLVLAFTVTLIKYTMPSQPVSSRLSLAQAVTSMNSKSKAVHIGIDSGQAAEDEGWGEGQPLVRIMTRDIRVMKRWGYEWEGEDDGSQATVKSEPNTVTEESKAKEPALRGVDLEALKKANQPGAKSSSSQLPIYTAQSARAYLMKSFETPPAPDGIKQEAKSKTKHTVATTAAQKERNLGLLLGALDLLFQSWAIILSKEDLDKRAWGWYVNVRPEVAQGAAGWGGKGNIKLSDILDLRRSDTQGSASTI